MNQNRSIQHKMAGFITALMASFSAFAQDAQLDVNVNSDNGGFFTSPWVWVIGGAVFILLLVALLRGNGRTREV